MAHKAYLVKDYQRSLGIVQTCLMTCSKVYPIAMIYLNLVVAMDLMNLKETDKAKVYFMKVWEISRPDNLIEGIGEHHGLLQGLIEACMKKDYPEDYARITQELVLQDLTFDFINSYALRHPNIAPINEFKITDEIYNEFKTYLKEKKFSYETESQQILNKLIEAAKAEKYYDTAKEQIAALENDFTHSIDRDMDLFKDEITSFLTEQFIQRYYYLQGVIEYKVQHDQEVAKAVEVLNDKEVYRNTLKPVK